MGLMPPSSLFRAIREAPKKKERMEGGVLPKKMKLRNLERESNRAFPPSPEAGSVMSFKCWGRSPSGPPAEPLRNDFIAMITSSHEKSKKETETSEEISGNPEASAKAGGCFAFRAVKVSSL